MTAGQAPPSLARRLARPRSVASVLVAAVLLGFSLYRLGPETLADTWQLMRGTNPWLYLAALGVYYGAFPLRALRWRILLENAGVEADKMPRLRHLAEIIYLSWFANALTPAKLGDLYRGWLLRKVRGASWSRAMGTIVAERLLDVLVLVVLMIATGLVAYRPLLRGNAPRGMQCNLPLPAADLGPSLLKVFLAGGAVAAMVLAGLVVFARFGTHLERVLPGRLGAIYLRFSGALVLSFGRFAPLLILSLGAWAAEAGRFLLVGRAMGQSLPIALVFFFSLASAFLTTVPVTPGGVGFEFLLAGALCLRGFPAADAWALALADRSLSYLSLVVGGAILYAWSPRTK